MFGIGRRTPPAHSVRKPNLPVRLNHIGRAFLGSGANERSRARGAMITSKQVLELISVFTAFISGMTLYYAGLGIRRRQQAMKWVGIPTGIIALAAQVTAILLH